MIYKKGQKIRYSKHKNDSFEKGIILSAKRTHEGGQLLEVRKHNGGIDWVDTKRNWLELLPIIEKLIDLLVLIFSRKKNK